LSRQKKKIKQIKLSVMSISIVNQNYMRKERLNRTMLSPNAKCHLSLHKNKPLKMLSALDALQKLMAYKCILYQHIDRDHMLYITIRTQQSEPSRHDEKFTNITNILIPNP